MGTIKDMLYMPSVFEIQFFFIYLEREKIIKFYEIKVLSPFFSVVPISLHT